MGKYKGASLLKNIYVPIYGVTVSVLIADTCKDAAESNKVFRKVFKHTEWSSQGYYCVDKKKAIKAIVLRGDASMSTIAHECLHATFDILSDAGMALSNDSEEAYTYLLGHLVDQVLIHFKRFQKLNKK